MKRIVLALSFLFFTMRLWAGYQAGALDTTANGGTGFNITGYVQTDIGTGTSDIIYGVAIQPDGKIVAVGMSDASLALVRYTINGDVDTTFGIAGKVTTTLSGSSVVGKAVKVLSNGKIVIAGQRNDSQFFIAQFLSNGTLDTAGFGGGTGFAARNVDTTIGQESIDSANALAVDNSGNIYLVGTSNQTAHSQPSCIFIARYTSTGVLDTTYNSIPTVSGGGTATTVAGIGLLCIGTDTLTGSAVALDSSGEIVIAGSTSAPSSMLIARFTAGTGAASGILDTTFNTVGYNAFNLMSSEIAYGVGLQSTGQIILAGTDGTHVVLVAFTNAGALDTSFNGSLGYNNTAVFGSATVAGAYAVSVQSDDKIVVTGHAVVSGQEQFLIARYLADGTALDENFGTSAGYTLTDVSSMTTVAYAGAVQQNGSFIAGGMIVSGATDFLTARYLGEQGVQGAMDISYQNSSTPGFKTYPTQNPPSANKPQVKALQTTAMNNLYVLAASTATVPRGYIAQLDVNGEVQLAVVEINEEGPRDLIVDSEQRALVVGANADNDGWLWRSTSVNSLAADPSFGSAGLVLNSAQATAFTRVGEQAQSRIVIIGQASIAGDGLLIAYNEDGVLANSSQSLCPAFGDSAAGFITLGSVTMNDMLIDATDCIYVACQDNGSGRGVGNNQICLVKYLADGTQPDPDFGTSGFIATGWTTTDYGVPVLSFDASGNIVIAAVEISTGNIKLQRYASNATVTAVTSTILQTTTLLSTPVITKLQCDTANRLIFTGYDSDNFFVGRCAAGAFTLDTTFAPYSSASGILKVNYNDDNPTDSTTPKRVSNSLCINNLGNILFGGYENVDTNGTLPLVGQVVGDMATPATQVTRYPGAPVDGVLDTNFGTNGALNLSGAPASLPSGQVKAFNVLQVGAHTGNMLVATSPDSTTTLTMLQADYTKDMAAFDGFGSVFFSQLDDAQAILVDPTGLQYYVVGKNAALYRCNYASDLGSICQSSNLNPGNAYALAQQSSGRILVGGYDATHNSGVIVAYTPAGVIDTSFNPQPADVTQSAASNTIPGYWYTKRPRPVTAISVGTQPEVFDKIYYAMANGMGNAVVIRLLENATGFDTTFTFGSVINSVSDDTQVKIQLDETGKIILAANTGATAGIQAARYTMDGTDDVAPATIISDAIDQTLEDVISLSDGTTLILTSQPNATASSAFMNLARLNSDFLLDVFFNPAGDVPGILTTNVPAAGNTPVMKDFYAVDISSAGGILIAGDDEQTASVANPYFAGVVNSGTPTRVSQSATSLGLPGELNMSFNSTGANPGFMNLTNEISTVMPDGTIGKVFLQNSDGSYYVAGDDGTDTYIAFMNADNVQDVVFGIEGRVTILDCADVAAMMFTQDGNLLVIGGDGVDAGWVRLLDPVSGSFVDGFEVINIIDSNFTVAQQSNGRIIVGGSLDGVGTFIAYNSVTGAVDETFGDGGYIIPIVEESYLYQINSMLVDQQDNIYFIGNQTDGTVTYLVRISSDGTMSNGPLVSGGNDSAYNNHLAFNAAGNIVATSVVTNHDLIVVGLFNPSTLSVLVPTLVLSSDGSIPASIATGIINPHVTDLITDDNSNIILTGYDSATTPSTPFVFRVLANLSDLDTTFNAVGAYPGVQLFYGSGSITGTTGASWYGSMITATGTIMLTGFEFISGVTTPYMMALYGDEFIGQYTTSVTAGTPGTIDTNFVTNGNVDLGQFSAIAGAYDFAGDTPVAIIPLANGYQYVASQEGLLMRLTNDNQLDTTYGGANGFAATSMPGGVAAMMMDGENHLVGVGTVSGDFTVGWVAKYGVDSGDYDPDFCYDDSHVPTTIQVVGYQFSSVVQQSLARYVVGGSDVNSGHGILKAFKNKGPVSGMVDVTFNPNGDEPGTVDLGIVTNIYALIADAYDRLIIAYLNDDAIDICRLTSNGSIDTTFGVDGIIAGAIAHGDDAAQVCLAFDASGNIVVAAHTTSGIVIKAYDNDAGDVVEDELALITIITNEPTLSQIVGTADGKVLVAGSQSGSNSMWVARIQDDGAGAYELDTTFGGDDGIMTFSFDGAGTVTGRALTAMAMYGDGQISLIGTETDTANDPDITPFMSRAYNQPYTTQEPICLGQKPQGTADATLGIGITPAYVDNGITFFLSNDGDDQQAQAVALQADDQSIILVAGQGTGTTTTNRSIYLNVFNIDGLLDTDFVQDGAGGTVDPGQSLILSMFDEQYINGMVTFTTASGVNKAILAGYAFNTALSAMGSLVIQCNLTPEIFGLDRTFGGFNNNSLGVAFGNGKQLNTVGLQSTGRIIASGLNQSNNGLVLAYTSTGNLDQSFGQGGTFVQGTTGIYTSSLDVQDRLLIAYNDGSNNIILARILADGSALDTSFGPDEDGIYLLDYDSRVAFNNDFRMVIAQDQTIFLVVGIDDGTQVAVNHINANGTSIVASTTFAAADFGGVLSDFMITQLLIDQQGALIMVGNDGADIMIARFVLDGGGAIILDTTFNSGAGYVRYAVGTGIGQLSAGALIHPDGRIIITGGQQ